MPAIVDLADRFLLAISTRVLQDEITTVKEHSKKIARAPGVHEVIRAFDAHFGRENYDVASK
jgi:hypothetical protein